MVRTLKIWSRFRCFINRFKKSENEKIFALRNNNGKCQLGLVLGIFGHQFFTPKCLQENFCFFTSIFGIHSIQHMRCVKPARYHIRETPRYFFVVSWPCMGIFKYINDGLSGESQTQFLYQKLWFFFLFGMLLRTTKNIDFSFFYFFLVILYWSLKFFILSITNFTWVTSRCI